MRLQSPTIRGRARHDPASLALVLLTVVLATALASSAGPLVDTRADRATSAAVDAAGASAALVSTFPRSDQVGADRVRDPSAADQLAADRRSVEQRLPPGLRDALRPGLVTVTGPTLTVLGGGPGRSLTLVAVPDATVAAVRYAAGSPPAGTSGGVVEVPTGSTWPVQVALSAPTARALGVGAGDRLRTEDPRRRPVVVDVTGVLEPVRTGDGAWQVEPGLLVPGTGTDTDTDGGVPQVSATALVPAAAVPDLRLAVSSDQLVERVTFVPRADRITAGSAPTVVRQARRLETAGDLARGGFTWDTGLDVVLGRVGAEVATARGRADVLLVALLAASLLVLVQVGAVVLARRQRSVVLSHERGATLGSVAGHLAAETGGVALVGALVVGLASWALVGRAGAPALWLALPAVAAAVTAVQGAALATRYTDPGGRNRRLPGLLLAGLVVGVAALSLVALHQRGVADSRFAASAPTWLALVGSAAVAWALPRGAGLLRARTRGSTGATSFLVTARLGATRRLPVATLTFVVAQLTLAGTLAATEPRGPMDGLDAALVDLAVASCVVLLVLALVTSYAAGALDADGRRESLGRLRSLGATDSLLRRVLLGERLFVVVTSTVTGLLLGVVVTSSTTDAPATGVPWWLLAPAVVVVAATTVDGLVELRRVHRRSLGALLREGAP